jgi:hypothetical protein
MATVSILPDTEFRQRDPSTTSWHFINLCLQDGPEDVAARCNGNCVVAKINEYATRLRTGSYDKWGGQGDLAFLIHLVGDIFQPLHAANNDDQGGNCIKITAPSQVPNLHIIWDVVMVTTTENNLDSGAPRITARALEAAFTHDRTHVAWNSNTAAQIALSSKHLAQTQIYGPLKIPLEPCEPEIHSCRYAPKETVTIDQSYIDGESRLAGEQLAKAGFALAELLNGISR